jgi:tetratricopeptide (TPR) repeat protein
MRPRRPTVHDHNSLGVHFYSVGAYDLAIAELEKAVALAPEIASLHFNLGGAFYNKERVGDAEREFRLALALEPGHVKAHWFRGLCLEKMGHLSGALEEFQWVRRNSAGTREARSAGEEIHAIGLRLKATGTEEHRTDGS